MAQNHHPNTAAMKRGRKAFRAECEALDRPCWLCGFPVDFSIPSSGPDATDDSFQLDHYFPASTHPELYEDPANWRCSHAGCNRARSNEKPMPALGTTSRNWLAPLTA